jgi:hypothetical protein
MLKLGTSQTRLKAAIARVSCLFRHLIKSTTLAMAAIVATMSVASAETLLMPERDLLKGTSEVVWGISTLANGTAYTIDFGDGSAVVAGNVVDRSYIAFNHTYALAGTFTVTLTVGAEVATTKVRVYDPAVLSAAELRGVKINRAIEDGLRWLWVTQTNRTTFDTNPQTAWSSSWPRVGTSLVVLGFENHGYKVPNNASVPTGIYPKYLVQRGLNYIVANLAQQTLTAQPAGNPCVGAGIEATNCVGLSNPDSSPGYGTAVAALALGGSSALSRTIPAGLTGSTGTYVAGKTLGEVLQRMINTVAWGQIDAGCIGRGAWTYSLINGFCTTSDGSTVGWDVLALLNAEASGITVPAFVKTEFAFALASMGNTNGSFDYNGDGNPAVASLQNVARAGIYLQSLYYMGVPLADVRVQAAISFINARWTGANLAGDYTGTCSNLQNKACAYGMYNVFKGLKLYGVDSLSAASDWYAEYQDWLVANQTDPNTTTGGSWQGGTGKTAMVFSCCAGTVPNFNAAIAELILAPVALIAPDPDLFSTVGLSPATATNPVGTNHTVTAFAQAANGAPIPGVTIDFLVLTGPNAGKSGSGTTGADGKTTFTYHDDGGAGTDTIQASIGTNLKSNIVQKIWASGGTCDVDKDGDIDKLDLSLITKARNQAASGPDDPRDSDGDRRITSNDAKVCILRCTRPNCATQ